MKGLHLVEIFLEIRGGQDVGADHTVEVHRLFVAIERQCVLLLSLQPHTVHVRHVCKLGGGGRRWFIWRNVAFFIKYLLSTCPELEKQRLEVREWCLYSTLLKTLESVSLQTTVASEALRAKRNCDDCTSK